MDRKGAVKGERKEDEDVTIRTRTTDNEPHTVAAGPRTFDGALRSSAPRALLTLGRYIRFCLVGGSGVLVDMTVLWLLASPAMLGWNLSLSKAIAAEVAILNNFLWNDLWTFRDLGSRRNDWRARSRRLGRFNFICLTGIGLSVLMLNAQVHTLRLNLYAANLTAIVLVSLWNFCMNLRFGWGKERMEDEAETGCGPTDEIATDPDTR